MIAHTKIIATLGPASTKESVLRKMFIGGMDIARLNFSHGTLKEHRERIILIRGLNKKMRRAVKIMQDLEGYRLRVGKLSKKEVFLQKNHVVYFVQDDIIGDKNELSFDYRGSLTVIKKGSQIYIDDGKILLEIIGGGRKRLKAKVIIGGLLKEKKGINILGADLEFDALTAKDRGDLKTALEYNLDYVAQSFVRSAKDINLIRGVIASEKKRCRVFAKVENKKALLNIDEIIDASDGIIVARGDLGICLPIYKVPVIQKEIVKKCRFKNKPVVVATQMLDSMASENIPTRAEVSDVANAILDGATHLMLSAETAVGINPPGVISMMNKVIKNTENYQRTGSCGNIY